MLVEHVFITTLDAEPALEAARLFLGQLGFREERCDDTAAIRFLRGHLDPRAVRTISEQPQCVLLDFDRGRVTVAASIREHRKAGQLHTDLLLALTRGLELLLAQGQPAAEARDEWDRVEERIASDVAARWRRNRNALLGCLGILALVITILVLVTTWSARP